MGQHIPRKGVVYNVLPVMSKDGEKLMPTIPPVARHMIRTQDATPYWSNGVFYVRLNREPSGRYKQAVAVGVDPGSKKEGFTVKSEAHTYQILRRLNFRYC